MVIFLIMSLLVCYKHVFLCSVDCEYEVSCGECSTSCGEGIKTCTGHILQKPKYGGKKCPFNHGKTWTEQCTKPPCKRMYKYNAKDFCLQV